MTNRLEEIRARERAATKGPWHTAKRRPALIVAADRARVADCHVGIGMALDEAQINAEFIANAREDISYLLSLLDARPAVAADARAGGHHLPNYLWCKRCQAWIETDHLCGAKYIDRGDHFELVRPAAMFVMAAVDARELAEQVMNQVAVGAWQFCSREWNIQNCAEAITTYANQRGEQVRQVLEGLSFIPFGSTMRCWCVIPTTKQHTPKCEAARALYVSLNQPTDKVAGQ